MIHARSDYMHIQDNTGKIKEDEPVFLLRAKDKLAPGTLRFWANMLEEAKGDPIAIAAARKHAEVMKQWQKENGSKFPDTPAGTVSI